MKTYFSYAWLVLVLSGIWSAGSANAQALRTQVVALHKGWNAVQLEVAPTNSKPADCFRNVPVTVAAAYVGDGTAVQFVQNPSTNTINGQNGWLVWYAPSRPDAFLTRVFSLAGNTAYLLYAQSDCVWSVTGTVAWSPRQWRADSFNLAGFGVDALSPPTFDQFFAGSAAHRPYRIYRLVNDQWTLVDRPQSTQMRASEACWIFCRGSSDYQGPLYTGIQSAQALQINGSSPAGVLLANKSGNPLTVRVENLSGSSGLPLNFVLRAVTESNLVTATYNLPTIYNAPTFEAGESRGLWLTLRAASMTASEQYSLLKITTDIGTQTWLPVIGSRGTLSAAE